MGTKLQPGQFDCVAAAEPDEPIFTLLARDPSAPDLVREWAFQRGLLITAGLKPESDRAKVDEALRCAGAMDAWRRDNR
jgi:hypothetical protein